MALLDGTEADDLANALLPALTTDANFDVPDVDLSDEKYQIPIAPGGQAYQAIPVLTINDLTTGVINGTGSFDKIMVAMAAQLREEFDKGRITGADYTKAYIALVTAGLETGLQFILQKDQAYWAAQQAQVGSITAVINAETAKMQYATAGLQAAGAKADYALTKLKLATESKNYDTLDYSLSHTLVEQYNQLLQQTQLAIKQQALILEQTNAQRAQTLDTRTDGTPVSGQLGKQKELYTQQITSYQRDAEVKAAKLFTDAWITMKTMDEGLLPPTNYENTSLDAILASLKSNNGIG